MSIAGGVMGDSGSDSGVTAAVASIAGALHLELS